jgi:hypothetical protein
MDKYNINLQDQDAEIELFWYSFKEAMNNFYNSLHLEIINNNQQNIIDWSYNLNLLKKDKKYNEIETNIKNYISMYALDLIMYSYSLYHDAILIVNIKRWNKLSNKYNFNNKDMYDIRIIFFNIFYTLKENGISKDELDLIKNFNKIFLNYNYDDFIIYSLTNNKPKILELLKIINSHKLKNDITRLFPHLKFNINSKMVKNCQEYLKH